MEYLLLIATGTEPDAGPMNNDDMGEWLAEGADRGIRKFGHRLRPIEDATTVRKRGGEILLTDGPFTESKEWIAGFDVLERENLDEAIDYASRHPMSRFGRIEVRPFWPDEF